MTSPLLRSALFLPASNARALAKARTLPCDMVILDLEDAVGPAEKAAARAAAVAALAEGGFGARRVMVRANALDTPWGADDLAALAGAGAAAVLLPKVQDADDARAAAARLPQGTEIWAMIETAPAMLRLDAIAGSGALAGLVLGFNDLARDLRAAPGPGRAPLLGHLAYAVLAARAHGLAILDSVYNAIGDPAGFAVECAQARAYGCDGKTLIHPSQIDPCNAAFAPDAEEIARARAIVAAFAEPANAGRGALQVDGRMVERLHLEQAERTLALAGAT